MSYRICTKCKKELPATVEYFHRHKRGKYGLRSICRDCNNIEIKKYASQPRIREKKRLRMVKYRKDNPEKAREYTKATYHLRKDKVNKYRREKYASDGSFRDNEKARKDKYRINISDGYILDILKLKPCEVPQDVIQTKRLIIKLKRELKK